ncbi:MAG TPA: hypothetical protein GX509_05955, partial [Firmicutes bacterium]|nr:hypothetical protein [Bacillota bacterium]
SLAVSVGSIHRMKIQEARLDIDRIKKIKELTGIPLVLHGASGVTDEGYRLGIPAGICKINIATELNKAFTRGVKEAMEKNPNEVDPRKALTRAKDLVKEVVKAKMRLFGCSGKAGDTMGRGAAPMGKAEKLTEKELSRE